MSYYLDWNPAMRYVWTKEQVQKWAIQSGGCALYNGVVWDMQYREIAPDRFAVSFTRRTPDFQQPKNKPRILVVLYDDGTHVVKTRAPIDLQVDIVDYKRQCNFRNIRFHCDPAGFAATDDSMDDDNEDT